MPRKMIGLPWGEYIVEPFKVSLAGANAVLVGGVLELSMGAIAGACVGEELPPQPANIAPAPIRVNRTVRRCVETGIGSDGIDSSLLLGLNMISLSLQWLNDSVTRSKSAMSKKPTMPFLHLETTIKKCKDSAVAVHDFSRYSSNIEKEKMTFVRMGSLQNP